MPLEGKDRDLVVKCLGMATSVHDGEALSALRKANAVLARLKLTWAEVMAAPAGAAWRGAGESPWKTARRGFESGWDPEDLMREARDQAQKNRRTAAEEATRRRDAENAATVKRAGIESMFQLLLASDRLPPLKRDYFLSMYDRWKTSGALPMAQHEALKRAYHVFA